MKINSPEYWNDRYITEDTPWDIGHESPQLMEYCQNLDDQSIQILIPGGGRAYEMSKLWDMGFHNIFLCDWAEEAIEEAQRLNPQVPGDRFLWANYFDLKHDFDLVLEQTFFCALPPDLRPQYAERTYELLKARKGHLVGVFFDREFDKEGPPFGGNRQEYEGYLKPYFDIKEFDWARSSIEPRQGTERFLIAQAKSK